jgi:hypothetical protein
MRMHAPPNSPRVHGLGKATTWCMQPARATVNHLRALLAPFHISSSTKTLLLHCMLLFSLEASTLPGMEGLPYLRHRNLPDWWLQ